MSQALIQRGYQQAKKHVLIQAAIIILIASLGLLKEFKVAVALLSGGAAVVLANAYFVYKAFSKAGAQQSKNVMRAFYFGETVKIILSASILVITFVLLPDFAIYALVGYVAALLTQWLAPMIIKTH